METCFNYYDPEKAFFSSDERKWINKIRKLQKQYPDKIRVLAEPGTNDGCIYVQLPSNWLRVQPKVERNLSEEDRARLSMQMQKCREKKTGSSK